MASNPVTQPSYFAREGCAVSEQGDLFTIEFPGGELTMPPHQFMALLTAGRAVYNDWSTFVACRDVVAWDPKAGHRVLAFPKACPIVRCKGEPC